MQGGSLLATKPPPARASRAALLAAAMTEGSSVTMGTRTSRPFTMKLSATPSGSAWTAIVFSVMRAAVSSVSGASEASAAHSSAVSPATSAIQR